MKVSFGNMRKVEDEYVNFEQMNCVPPCEGLKQKNAELVKGMMNIWYEYVPKSYDGSKSVPLIVQLHGGGNDGKMWSNYVMWHVLAEKYGFIVIYPNSPDYKLWACTERDVDYIYDLIKLVEDTYNIDKTRIYMHGMSNGDMMTLAFSMKHPEVLAAAGYTTGSSPKEAIGDERPLGALPIIQMRGEKDVNWMLKPDTVDVYSVRYGMNDLNREIWLEQNGVSEAPVLSIDGRNNFLKFNGKNSPIINWEIKDMGHREPLDGAEVYWDYLYSGCRRMEDGSLELKTPLKDIDGDDDVIVICTGGDKIYKKDKAVAINSLANGPAKMFHASSPNKFFNVPLNEMYETPDLYAPAEFFKAAFDAEVEYVNPGEKVKILFKSGMKVELYTNTPLIKVDDEYRALKKPCCLICGVFYVPVGIFCEEVLGKFVSMADDTMCISGHFAQLGRYTARILKNYIK